MASYIHKSLQSCNKIIPHVHVAQYNLYDQVQELQLWFQLAKLN